MSPTATGSSLRRRACALALPAFPLVLVAVALVSPTDSDENAAQLRAAAAHPGRWQGAALLELLAAALLPFAVAGVVQFVRRRGAGLANAGAVLGVLGTLGMASIGLRHLFVYGLTATGQPAALRVLDRLDDHAGAVALPLMFAGPIALILLAAATARAGMASRWVVVGAFAFFVSDMLPIPAAEEIQGVIGLATFGAIALSILRHAGDQPEPAGGASPVLAPSTS